MFPILKNILTLSFLVIASFQAVSGDGTEGMTDYDRQAVLDKHNGYRSQTALGNTPGQPVATRMETMYWDTRLEEIANAHSAKCVGQHNDFRTEDYEVKMNKPMWWDFTIEDYIGENYYYSYPSSAPTSRMERAVESWFEEYEFYNHTDDSCCCDESCGHYTQVVRAENRYVGCSYTICNPLYRPSKNKNYSNAMFFVCNYFLRGWVDEPYPTGTTGSCSDCPSDTSSNCTNGLCSGCPAYAHDICHFDKYSNCASLFPTANDCASCLTNPTTNCKSCSSHCDALGTNCSGWDAVPENAKISPSTCPLLDPYNGPYYVQPGSVSPSISPTVSPTDSPVPCGGGGSFTNQQVGGPSSYSPNLSNEPSFVAGIGIGMGIMTCVVGLILFACYCCNKSTMTEEDLNTHMDAQTEEQTIENEPRRIKVNFATPPRKSSVVRTPDSKKGDKSPFSPSTHYSTVAGDESYFPPSVAGNEQSEYDMSILISPTGALADAGSPKWVPAGVTTADSDDSE